MSKLQFTVEGTQQAIRDIGLTEFRKRAALVKAVEKTRKAGLQKMKRNLSGPSPSPPGSPPGKRSNNYRKSWKSRQDGLTAEVFTPSSIAHILEFGAVHMGARPHAGPLSEEMKSDWIHNAKEALK